jgi:hypothetical protein
VIYYTGQSPLGPTRFGRTDNTSIFRHPIISHNSIGCRQNAAWSNGWRFCCSIVIKHTKTAQAVREWLKDLRIESLVYLVE